jgi:hypothetical protein
LLVSPSTGSIGNGTALAGANEGDSNTVESLIESVEIPKVHPTSRKMFDKTTGFTTSDPAVGIRHEIGRGYWLKGSSVTGVINQTKFICAASGLVKAQVAHTATPLPVHMWACLKTTSSATWQQGKYLGIVSTFTAA